MSDEPENLPALREKLEVAEVVAQADHIQQIMRAAMKDGEHFGVVPGTNRPTLLKPGAEKLCLTFRLDPEYEIVETFHDDGHYSVRTVCTLFHIPTGRRIASGPGMCSSRESKYAWRKAERVCPQCEKSAIIKGKKEFGGGWVCFKKKGGCGAKFPDGDQQIESQPTDRVPNPDLADIFNTVLKMSAKRSLVSATLAATAASDIFTQDVDDSDETPPPTPRDELFARIAALTEDEKIALKTWFEDQGIPFVKGKWTDEHVEHIFLHLSQPPETPQPAKPTDDDFWTDDGQITEAEVARCAECGSDDAERIVKQANGWLCKPERREECMQEAAF